MENHRYEGASTLRVLLLGLVVLVIAGFLGLNIMNQGREPDQYDHVQFPPAGTTHSLSAETLQTGTVTQRPDFDSLQDEITATRRNAIVRAIEEVEPAVVSITITQIIRTRLFPSIFDDPLFRHFFPEFRREYQRKVYGLGSGVIVNADGYILTNEHVIENAQEMVVTLTNGEQTKARLIGSDSRLDLAVIKIDGGGFPAAELGDSDDLIIGEWAIAIGNPFGFVLDKSNPTATVGVISAINRDFESSPGERMYKDMIQTDAAINQGNSGGPLVNSNGVVVGINTFIFTGGRYAGGSIGIGFAIPINKAKKVMNELLTYGRIRDFWTGISIQDVDWLIGQSLDLESTDGAIISQVDTGSPGEEAGLRVGDIIIEVNSLKVKDADDVIDAFAEGQVGDLYTLKVQRKEKKRTIRLELKEASP